MKNKTKYGLSAVFAGAAALSMSLGIVWQSAYAETTVSDVALTISTYEDLTKFESQTIGKETYDAYGAEGWGGFAKVLTLDKAYDVSAIANSNKGALTFWMYFGSQQALTAHQAVTQGWNVDVSSGATYSDATKYSYAIHNLFDDCELGWNKIVLPLATASEKYNLDWSSVQTLRMNCAAAGLNAAGDGNVRFAGFTFTTTEETAMSATPYKAEDVSLTVASAVSVVGGDGFTKSSETIGDKTVDAYGCDGWGGFAQVLTLDKAYDASEIGNSGKGALTFWMYFGTENSLTRYQGVTGGWNVDISSAESYSDSAKYSFAIQNLFASCKVGWNKIVLPLATAAEKNSMDWSTVWTIRLNCAGAGLNLPGDSSVKFADFVLTLTEETAMSATPLATGEEKPEEPTPDLSDVAVTIASASGLTKTSEKVGEETIDAYGCAGWGGFVDVLTLDKAYDVSDIANSGKGALSFWAYFDTEASLKAYQNVTTGWNVDVSSAQSYSDATKYSFAICNVFDECQVGWNKIEIPLSTALEKNSMDWSTVWTIRLNCVGAGLQAGDSHVKFGGFTFTTTDATAMSATPFVVDVPDLSDISLTIANVSSAIGGDGFTKSSETIADKTVDAYGCDGWGGFSQIFKFDKAYDASDIADSGKGAVTFWVYFGSQQSLTRYQEVTTGWNVDVSSAENYSDSYKYSFAIHALFDDCKLGWNKIVLPFETAAEKNSMDWSAVWTVRLNCAGAGLNQAGDSCVKFADFVITTTEETAMSATPLTTGEENPEEPTPDLSDVSLTVASAASAIGGDGFTKSNETIGEKTVDAYGCDGWGGFAQVLTLDKAYDASDLADSGKGALTFWIYFGTENSLTRYQGVTTGWNVDISSAQNYSDAAKYSFAIHALFDDCEVGWNKIVLPLSSAAEKNSMDWNTVWTIRLNCAGAGLNQPGDSCVKFADFVLTTTEDGKMSATPINGKTPDEPDEPDESVSVPVDPAAGKTVEFSSYQDMNKTEETIKEETLNAYGCVGYGWGAFVKVLTLDNVYDVSAVAETGKGALSFWMYIGDEATLNAYKGTTDFWSLDVSSDINYSDATKYSFMIAPTFGDLQIGWNKIVLPFETANEKNNMNWSTVSTFRLNCTGTTLVGGQNSVAFAGFTFGVTEETTMKVVDHYAAQSGSEDENLWMDSRVIIDCDSVGGTTFTGNKIDKEDFRYSTGCVYTSGAGYALNATDIEVGATGMTKSSIVLAFWIWIEDVTHYQAENLNGQIELSSSNSYDTNEISWSVEQWSGNLQNGWNWLVLKGSDATVTGGMPDFDNLKRFRIYVNNISMSTLKIDRITIGCVADEALFEEPDWENEKASAGIFKGANALVAENTTYIEVDFTQAEDYTVIETVTVNEEGCSSELGTAVWALCAGGIAAAVACVGKKDKRKEQNAKNE